MKNTCAFTPAAILINTVLLGVAASISHFAYDLSGQNIVVGLFNPVNESVWEHLKLMFFPLLLWWTAIYFIKSKNCALPPGTRIVSAAVSLITAPLTVLLLHYGFTGALGIESVFFDILTAYIGFFIALSVGSHFLKYSEPDKLAVIVSAAAVAVIFIAFIVFTFDPPQLPVFYDAQTGAYGI